MDGCINEWMDQKRNKSYFGKIESYCNYLIKTLNYSNLSEKNEIGMKLTLLLNFKCFINMLYLKYILFIFKMPLIIKNKD